MYSIIKLDKMEDGIKNCLLAYAEQGVRPKEVIKTLLVQEARRLGFVLTPPSKLPRPRKDKHPETKNAASAWTT